LWGLRVPKHGLTVIGILLAPVGAKGHKIRTYGRSQHVYANKWYKEATYKMIFYYTATSVHSIFASTKRKDNENSYAYSSSLDIGGASLKP